MHPLAVDGARRRAGALEWGWTLAWLLSCALALALHAQAAPATGPQQLAFAGLRAALNSQGQPQGQINAVRVGATGNLYLLIDQKDGVRLLETDPGRDQHSEPGADRREGRRWPGDGAGPGGECLRHGDDHIRRADGDRRRGVHGRIGHGDQLVCGEVQRQPRQPTLCDLLRRRVHGCQFDCGHRDAVFITGTVYLPNGTVPVTAAGIIQTPAFGSQWNGFVEKFSASGSSLLYATYLSGAGGNTTPAAIVADAADDAYIAGTTTAPGYPTVAALVPNQLVTTALGTTSGFLTKLTPAGDGIPFSTFIPGAGNQLAGDRFGRRGTYCWRARFRWGSFRWPAWLLR